jgi:type III restriction enzyme
LGGDDYPWDDLFSATREAEAERRQQQHDGNDEEGK